MTTEALMKRCQIGVPRGPNAYDQLHSILAECYGTLGAQATEIDRLRAEVAGLREALLRVARMAEALKKDCGMDPESPQAVRNGQYMNISYAARAALEQKP